MSGTGRLSPRPGEGNTMAHCAPGIGGLPSHTQPEDDCSIQTRHAEGDPPMQDEEFEWDDNKASANLAEHKIDFHDAKRVFADPMFVGDDDDTARQNPPN